MSDWATGTDATNGTLSGGGAGGLGGFTTNVGFFKLTMYAGAGGNGGGPGSSGSQGQQWYYTDPVSGYQEIGSLGGSPGYAIKKNGNTVTVNAANTGNIHGVVG
jgi:hypothetical protein